MTNQEIEDIYKAGVGDGHVNALRTVWNAGYYEGAGITPTATSKDKSSLPNIAKPVAVIVKKRGK